MTSKYQKGQDVEYRGKVWKVAYAYGGELVLIRIGTLNREQVTVNEREVLPVDTTK